MTASQPPDLLIQLEELATQLPQAIDRGKQRESVEDAKKSADALRPLVAKLDNWGATAVSFTDDVVPRADSFTAKAQALAEMGRELEDATSPVALERVALRWRQIDTTARELLLDGEQHWAGVLSSLQWCEALGSALEHVSVTADVGRKLKAVYGGVIELKTFPPTVHNCQRLQQFRQNATVLRDSLKDIHVGEAIQKFLLALARGEAVMALVDGEVLAWIKKHGVADHLQITFRSTSL